MINGQQLTEPSRTRSTFRLSKIKVQLQLLESQHTMNVPKPITYGDSISACRSEACQCPASVPRTVNLSSISRDSVRAHYFVSNDLRSEVGRSGAAAANY